DDIHHTHRSTLLDLDFLRRTRSAYCLRRSGIDDSEKSRLNADGFEAEPAIKVLRPVFDDRHEEDEPESRGGSERGKVPGAGTLGRQFVLGEQLLHQARISRPRLA